MYQAKLLFFSFSSDWISQILSDFHVKLNPMVTHNCWQKYTLNYFLVENIQTWKWKVRILSWDPTAQKGNTWFRTSLCMSTGRLPDIILQVWWLPKTFAWYLWSKSKLKKNPCLFRDLIYPGMLMMMWN